MKRVIKNVKEIKEFIESYGGTKKGLTVNDKDLESLVEAIPNIGNIVKLNTLDTMRNGIGELFNIGDINYPIGIIWINYEDETEEECMTKWYKTAYYGWNIQS